MKTIVIFYNSMAGSGGIERVISNLMFAWKESYHIILLTKDDSKNSFYRIPDEVKCFSIEEPLNLNMKDRKQRIKEVFGNTWRAHKKIKRVLAKIQFNYIYTATALNSLEVYLANKAYKEKMIISEHASAYAVNGIYQTIKKYVYPKAYCISVPNRMDVDVYKSWGCRAVYIPHLIPKDKSIEPNKLDTKIMLNVGRLTSDKRQAELIRCWGKVSDRKGWKLWIVGDGEEKDNLQKEISNLHLSDVKLIPATREIDKIYKHASAFVFTSRMEGFGMVLLEAMQYGIPCVSFDCPSGPRDIVKDGVNGYLVENDNMCEMSATIKKKCELDLASLQKLGGGALLTIANWDNDNILKSWKDIFA